VEIAALTKAFRRTSDRRGYCAVGSVKTNLGHLEVAAGIAGLIRGGAGGRAGGRSRRALHFERPNPQIDFAASPFFVKLRPRPLARGGDAPGGRQLVFGFGGTNAHVGAGGGAGAPRDRSGPPLAAPCPLPPRSAEALDAASRDLAGYLDATPGTDLADVAFTLQAGRQPFEHRRALAVHGADDARDLLAGRDPLRVTTGAYDGAGRTVCFLFPGQGAQHPGMARELYRNEGTFRGRSLEPLRRPVPAGGWDRRAAVHRSRPARWTWPRSAISWERTEVAQAGPVRRRVGCWRSSG